MPRLIALTTDFGLRDWFVGAMKGVIAGIAPDTAVIDLCHEIPPGDVMAGAFALWAGWPFFPDGTVHLAVVDPGVGTDRAAIALATERGVLIGPDNGILSLAARLAKRRTIYRIENPRFLLPERSQTFHGRDVFAPASAHLARGVAPGRLGPKLTKMVELEDPFSSGAGRIVYVDRFGNAITSMPHAGVSTGMLALDGKARRRIPIGLSYGSVPVGKAVAVPGSTGLWEIAVNGGDAAATLGVRVGDRVRWIAPASKA